MYIGPIGEMLMEAGKRAVRSTHHKEQNSAKIEKTCRLDRYFNSSEESAKIEKRKHKAM
jgi:hypothetical protein